MGSYCLFSNLVFAPMLIVPAMGLVILTHDNPYIFKGTEYGTDPVITSMTVSMYRLIIVAVCSFVTWVPLKNKT